MKELLRDVLWKPVEAFRLDFSLILIGDIEWRDTWNEKLIAQINTKTPF